MALHILQNRSANDDLFDKAAAERPLSKFRIPDHEADPKVMYRLIKDELMLDGNSRQNLATFCQTWDDPWVDRLMDISISKNMERPHLGRKYRLLYSKFYRNGFI